MTDQFTVDAAEYKRRDQRRRTEKYNSIVQTPRTGYWTPEEDAVAARHDITLVEKIALLQRPARAVSSRYALLNLPPRNCAECGREFRSFRATDVRCSRACSGQSRVRHHPRSCQHCGTVFKPKDAESKYCSRECCWQAAVTLQPRPCTRCGNVFQPREDKDKYCSKACGRALTVLPRPCQGCGIEFHPKSNERKFCSPGCGYATPKIFPSKPCVCCGTVFHPTAGNSKYCSAGCGRRNHRDPRRPRASTTRVAYTCLGCGTIFMDFRSNLRVYCSRSCRGAAYRAAHRRGCAVDGCDRTQVAQGWCKGHWQRWSRTGDVQADIPFRKQRNNLLGK